MGLTSKGREEGEGRRPTFKGMEGRIRWAGKSLLISRGREREGEGVLLRRRGERGRKGRGRELPKLKLSRINIDDMQNMLRITSEI